MLGLLAIISVVAGNLIAVAQTSLLRMLAYSAIANVGFILLGFASASGLGYSAALYYTLAYVLMTVAAFAVILIASREGCEADQLEHYKGLHQRDPLLAAVMAAVMFSTAGVPPFVGFWAKLTIIQALLGSGLTAYAIIAVVGSVIGAFYYLRVVWLMYFEPPGEQPAMIRVTGLRLVLAINALAVLVLGIVPDALLALCRQGHSRRLSPVTPRRRRIRFAFPVRSAKMRAPTGAGWSSLAARRAHNPKVAGSNPAPATNLSGSSRHPAVQAGLFCPIHNRLPSGRRS